MDRVAYGPLIVDTVERLAERGIDPTEAVYARLFAESPELEPLFIMGPGAKGHMLDEVLAVILDYVDTGRYATAFVRSERVNHENLGVPPDAFLRFFSVLADTLRDLSAEAWTPDHVRAWRALLVDLAAI